MRRVPRVRLAIAGLLALGIPAAAEVEAPPRLNVVLISLDTVRPDHLGCYGYRRDTSPHLDQIAGESAVFTRAYSQSPQTFPSHLSLLTSRYPTWDWLAWYDDGTGGRQNLTSLLRDAGYVTGAFVGFQRTHEGLGRLLAAPAFRDFETLVEGVSLRTPPDAVFDWLAAHRESPFLLFLHSFDAHDPHVLPVQYDAGRFARRYRGNLPNLYPDLWRLMGLTPAEVQERAHEDLYEQGRLAALAPLRADPRGRAEDLRHLQALYDAQIAYLDEGIGRLLTALRQLGLMDRTLVILFSDHGQAFGEHGIVAWHGQCYEEDTRILLLIRDPSMPARRIATVVEAADLMPTILERLGLPTPPGVAGRSLVPLMATGRDRSRPQRAVSAWQGMRALRTPRWRFIQRFGRADELYDVGSDPQQRRNLASREPGRAAALARELDALLPDNPHRPRAGVDLERLIREHGYW
jgi:arylsulfatase A-like enzyme